jgi:hypothetical protein
VNPDGCHAVSALDGNGMILIVRWVECRNAAYRIICVG